MFKIVPFPPELRIQMRIYPCLSFGKDGCGSTTNSKFRAVEAQNRSMEGRVRSNWRRRLKMEPWSQICMTFQIFESRAINWTSPIYFHLNHAKKPNYNSYSEAYLKCLKISRVDLSSLFGLNVHSCTHCAETPQPPPPAAFGLIYEGPIGQLR